jgi:hypothetical protein
MLDVILLCGFFIQALLFHAFSLGQLRCGPNQEYAAASLPPKSSMG